MNDIPCIDELDSIESAMRDVANEMKEIVCMAVDSWMEIKITAASMRLYWCAELANNVLQYIKFDGSLNRATFNALSALKALVICKHAADMLGVDVETFIDKRMRMSMPETIVADAERAYRTALQEVEK